MTTEVGGDEKSRKTVARVSPLKGEGRVARSRKGAGVSFRGIDAPQYKLDASSWTTQHLPAFRRARENSPLSAHLQTRREAISELCRHARLRLELFRSYASDLIQHLFLRASLNVSARLSGPALLRSRRKPNTVGDGVYFTLIKNMAVTTTDSGGDWLIQHFFSIAQKYFWNFNILSTKQFSEWFHDNIFDALKYFV